MEIAKSHLVIPHLICEKSNGFSYNLKRLYSEFFDDIFFINS